MDKETAEDIISEEEFRLLLDKKIQPLFRIINIMPEDPNKFNKRFYLYMFNRAEDIEEFMDDYGAVENAKFFVIRELVAAVRNISIASYEIKHTMSRFGHYKLSTILTTQEIFLKDATMAIDGLNRAISCIYESMKEEAADLQIEATTAPCMEEEIFSAVSDKRRLPATVVNEGNKGNEENMLELTRKYRKVWKIFREENLACKRKSEELREVAGKKITEKKIQKFTNILLNVQSDYDTNIINTELESSDPNLRKFRKLVSIPLHLLEATKWLVHFYERHCGAEKLCGSRHHPDQVANVDDILTIMNNFSLHYTWTYIREGNRIAEEVLTTYMKTTRYELPIPTPLGFHARPSTYISMVVNEHGSDVFVLIDDERFNAKSVLDLMEAGGMIADKGLKTITFEGDERVLNDIKILAEHNYCEDQDIPRELNYLRIARNIKGEK